MSQGSSTTMLKIYRALSHRPIFILWTGEAFSAIGDEVYKVALVWLAVKMIGANAGYLSAAQAGAVLVTGFVGGIWADHWDPRRTMIGVDWLRALVVIVPVVWLWFMPLNLGMLFFVAIFVAGMGAFFEPALQAVVPRLARDRGLMQATNGLMGTTGRLARAVGPGLVGALTGIIPIIHFFTLDALSFGASAYALWILKRELPSDRRGTRRTGLIESCMSGYHLVRSHAPMRYVLVAKAICSGAWCIVLPLGMALIVQAILPGDVRAYGFLLAAYGAGNLLGALVLSNISMNRPLLVMAYGFMVLGLGLSAMALSSSMTWMMIFAAVAAVGGPMNDLAHIDVIQNQYSSSELVKVVRFRMVIEYGGILVCLLLAPTLFAWFTARTVVAAAGGAITLTGIAGYFRYYRFFEKT